MWHAALYLRRCGETLGLGRLSRDAKCKPKTVRFGMFEVDFDREEVRRKGVRIKLQRQPFQLLRLLLESHGEFVTRERIRKALWPEDQFVDFEQSISTAILRLRRSLRESPGAPVYIESVARRGYRFIAPVASTSASAVPRQDSEKKAVKSINPKAYESFLKGNFQVSFRAPQSLEKAFVFYQTAIDLEPEWAPPYSALAEAHRVADFSKAIPSSDFVAHIRDLTGKALNLDPDNAQAHATMGAVRAIYEWKWREGEEQLRLALNLAPQSSQVEHLYSTVLLSQQKYDEALVHADAALALDHSSLFLRSHRVQVLHFSRRIEEAVVESRDFLDEHPDFAMGLLNYGAALLDLGRAAEALPVLERLYQKTSMPAALCAIAHAHYELGHRKEAQDHLEQIYRIKETRGCSAMILALGHVVIHETDQAIQWLKIALEERDYRLVLLGAIIPFDKIRNTPEFRHIYNQIYGSGRPA
jgi:DNA-binding winged helix-turn-helix (wHTH) protein